MKVFCKCKYHSNIYHNKFKKLLARRLYSNISLLFLAVCTSPCQNGGKCIRPEVCSCAAGFSGRLCELDRNECAERKPCDQFCHNTPGSFYCSCRPGFTLHTDRESCRRSAEDRVSSGGGNSGDVGRRDDAFEARDMENDVTVDYGGRVVRIEEVFLDSRSVD